MLKCGAKVGDGFSGRALSMRFYMFITLLAQKTRNVSHFTEQNNFRKRILGYQNREALIYQRAIGKRVSLSKKLVPINIGA